MNQIYEEMKRKKDAEATEAVHKFVEAVNAFQKLNPYQKELFFRNVVLQRIFTELSNGNKYNTHNT